MEPKPPNVLLAYDASEPSRRALDRVSTLMPNASVAVVSVAAPVYRAPNVAKFADKDEEERQRSALTEATTLLAESGIDARSAARSEIRPPRSSASQKRAAPISSSSGHAA